MSETATEASVQGNRWLYVTCVLAVIAAVAVGVIIGRTASYTYDNCQEIEDLKTLIRGTLTDSRNAALRSTTDPGARAEISKRSNRELSRYAATDCGI